MKRKKQQQQADVNLNDSLTEEREKGVMRWT